MAVLSLTLTYSLSACGPKAFEGLLAPAPEWVFMDLSKWDQREKMTTQLFALYGRGSAQGQPLIANRRALAEREAVLHAKSRFIEMYRQHLAAAHYAPDHLRAIGELPWEQVAVTTERFFDAEKNTQHVLVMISQDRLNSAIRFEKSADLNRGPLWDSIAQELNRFYQRSPRSPETQSLQAPNSP